MMAQSEGFKEVQTLVNALEKRLSVCKNINQICEQSAREAGQEIEEHFAKCFNALAARKAELLKQVTTEMANHSMF